MGRRGQRPRLAYRRLHDEPARCPWWTYLTVNAPNYVGDKAELGRVVREVLIQEGRRTGGQLFGGYA